MKKDKIDGSELLKQFIDTNAVDTSVEIIHAQFVKAVTSIVEKYVIADKTLDMQSQKVSEVFQHLTSLKVTTECLIKNICELVQGLKDNEIVE